MSELLRDIAEEDEVQRLLSRPERHFETPTFQALSVRQHRRAGPLRPTVVFGAAGLLLVMALVLPVIRADAPGALDGSRQTVTSTAGPMAVPPGGTLSRASACAEIPTPEYVPRRSSRSVRSGRSDSSDDVVTLTLQDLVVDGNPSELTITAQAAPPKHAHVGATRPVGSRGVTLTAVQPATSTPPPGVARRTSARSELIAAWSEPESACPYFFASLISSSSNADALESELVKIVASMPMSSAAPRLVHPVAASEAEAWARVRATFANGPIAMPVWLPAGVDRSRVELRALRVTPMREYEIVYRDSEGEQVLNFRLGPVEPIQQSALSLCCVRGVRATMHVSTNLFTDPAIRSSRQIRWEEQGRTMSFTSQRIASEDMLRIAWSLDRTTAPPNSHASARSQRGACASSAGPEETVVRLLSLAGSRNRDVVSDCYSLDALSVGGDVAADWAGLPSTTAVLVRAGSEIAGRRWVDAEWRFTTPAGTSWSEANARSFLLGREDGVWRIFDVADKSFLAPP